MSRVPVNESRKVWGILDLELVEFWGQRLFVNGWGFFVPYLLLYVIFWRLSFGAQLLRALFVVLHLFFLLLFCGFVSRRLLTIRPFDWFFWGALSLLFVWPGIYLEFPGDPWEHLRRLYSWGAFSHIAESPVRDRFAYYWGWTILGWIEPEHRRLALTLYGAFWQLLLAYQFYLFCRCMGFSREWGKIQALAFIGLFGTSVFSMRYYVLSSTPLAYIAYLQCLIVMADGIAGSVRRLWTLALLVPLVILNHFQEFYFLLLSGSVLIAHAFFYRLSLSKRKIVLIGIGILFLGSLVFGYFARQYFAPIYDRLGPNTFTRFGTFQIFRFHTVYVDTLGVAGVLGVISALYRLKYGSRVAWLTLAPLALLVFPPWVRFVAPKLSAATDVYRVLYAMPLSLALVALGHCLSQRFRGLWPERAYWAMSVVLILALSLMPRFPLRGRLWFQMYRAPAQLALESLDQTAQWFSKNRTCARNCWIISDDITGFSLTAHLGLRDVYPRFAIRDFGNKITNDEVLRDILHYQDVCAFLIGIRKDIAPSPPSKVATLSGHWHPRFADIRARISPGFEAVGQELLTRGWNRTFVPPFYYLYEPPSNRTANFGVGRLDR